MTDTTEALRALDMLQRLYKLDNSNLNCDEDLFSTIRAALTAPAQPVGYDESAARERYNASIPSDAHNLHFVSWSELTETQKQKWRSPLAPHPNPWRAVADGPIPNLTLVKKPFETYLTIREADGDRELTRKEVQTLLAYYRYGVDASLAPSYAEWRASSVKWRAVADGLAKYAGGHLAACQWRISGGVHNCTCGHEEALAAYTAAKEADKS